jgi:hypothetical protein
VPHRPLNPEKHRLIIQSPCGRRGEQLL